MAELTRTASETRVQRRLEQIKQILEDASADGLQGYNPDRLEDLIVRDLAEFLLIRKWRSHLLDECKREVLTESVHSDIHTPIANS